MKIYKNTRTAFSGGLGQTMTVGELREKLAEYPGDMPVFGSWEGVAGYVVQESFSVAQYTKNLPEDKEPCLFIDVEDY